jgi:hypothetical protein
MQNNESRERLREMVIKAMQSPIIQIKAAVRDTQEPQRRAKMELENKIRLLFERRFREQRRIILAALAEALPNRKAIYNFDDWINSLFGQPDQNFTADVLRLVLEGTVAGIDVFQLGSSIELDYTAVNANAREAVNQYVGNLIRDVDQNTLASVRQSVSQFIETPGMTMGDLRAALPFDERRANNIAVTEVTRAYGEGERMAGERMQAEYPDVKVIKKWYTNEDSKVCPLCGPLGKANKWIPLDQPFDIDPKRGPIMNPPRHVNCRCWIATRTKI